MQSLPLRPWLDSSPYKLPQPAMSPQQLDALAQDTRRQITIVSSCVAYAVATIEADAAPRFQLGTSLRMGLNDDEVNDPKAVALMRWEYRAWVVGHGLADIAESLGTFLNRLVEANPTAVGFSGQLRAFERLGLDKKYDALLPSMTIEGPFQEAVWSLTRARNCLIHRHGVVGTPDCNQGNELVLRWVGPQISREADDGYEEIEAAHRGPAGDRPGTMMRLSVDSIERRFASGSRLDLEPSDLSTISWCVGGIAGRLHERAKQLLFPKLAASLRGSSVTRSLLQ